MNRLKVVICWPELTGYMAACFRKLKRREEVDFLVLATRGGIQNPDAPYGDEVAAGYNCFLCDLATLRDPIRISDIVCSFKPEIVYVSGWNIPAYVRLFSDPRLSSAKFIIGMDNPQTDSWRQRLARLKIGRILRSEEHTSELQSH